MIFHDLVEHLPRYLGTVARDQTGFADVSLRIGRHRHATSRFIQLAHGYKFGLAEENSCGDRQRRQEQR